MYGICTSNLGSKISRWILVINKNRPKTYHWYTTLLRSLEPVGSSETHYPLVIKHGWLEHRLFTDDFPKSTSTQWFFFQPCDWVSTAYPRISTNIPVFSTINHHSPPWIPRAGAKTSWPNGGGWIMGSNHWMACRSTSREKRPELGEKIWHFSKIPISCWRNLHLVKNHIFF